MTIALKIEDDSGKLLAVVTDVMIKEAEKDPYYKYHRHKLECEVLATEEALSKHLGVPVFITNSPEATAKRLVENVKEIIRSTGDKVTK